MAKAAAVREPPVYALPNWRVSKSGDDDGITLTGWIDVDSRIPAKIKPYLNGNPKKCYWYCGKQCKLKYVRNVTFSVTSVKWNSNGWHEFKLDKDFAILLYDSNVSHNPDYPRPSKEDIEKVLKIVM